MRTIKISEFKAKCLQILDGVARTGETLVITRRGRPLARVLPFASTADDGWLGCLEGTADILADLTEPVVGEAEWEAARP